MTPKDRNTTGFDLGRAQAALAGLPAPVAQAVTSIEGAIPPTMPAQWGIAGADFVTAWSNCISEHAAAITALAGVAASYAPGLTQTGKAFYGTDDANRDALHSAAAGGYAQTPQTMAAGSAYPAPLQTHTWGDNNGGGYLPAPPAPAPPAFIPAAPAGAMPRAGEVAMTVPKAGRVIAPNPRAAQAVSAALGQVGAPYVWGGQGPQGEDCSGLTKQSYAAAGLDLPRVAADQKVGRLVSMNPRDAAPGDLLVWSGHVAIAIGNGYMVEAQTFGLPAAIDPVRSDNVGDDWYGVWRPTEGA